MTRAAPQDVQANHLEHRRDGRAGLSRQDRFAPQRGCAAVSAVRRQRCGDGQDSDALAGARLIVATDLDGNPRDARIRQAVQITESAASRPCFSDRIVLGRSCANGQSATAASCRVSRKSLDAIALDDRVWKDAPPEADGASDAGWGAGSWVCTPAMTDAARRFISPRCALHGTAGHEPCRRCPTRRLLSEHSATWLLAPSARLCAQCRMTGNVSICCTALRARLDWEPDAGIWIRLVPGRFTTPLGRDIPIDYSGEHPEISLAPARDVRPENPSLRVGRTPLRVTLLSPARPSGPDDAWIFPDSGKDPMPMCARTCARPIPNIPGPKTRHRRTRPCEPSANTKPESCGPYTRCLPNVAGSDVHAGPCLMMPMTFTRCSTVRPRPPSSRKLRKRIVQNLREADRAIWNGGA